MWTKVWFCLLALALPSAGQSSNAASPVIVPAALTGSIYTQTLAATGTAPITWSVTSGTLPAGLSLGSSTGIVSGTPMAPGIFAFTITATNASGSNSKPLSLTVSAAPTPPSIVTASPMPSALTGSAYTQTLAATGTAAITWSVTSGALPAGLSLTSSTGIIRGTPTAAGIFTFTVSATNEGGSNSKSLSLIVNTPPGITTISPLPGARTGSVYTQTLAAAGTAPITWSVTSGTLPAGLSLGSSTGVIGGTPTAAGVFTPTITATNAGGSNSQQLSLTVNTAPVVVTASRLPGALTGSVYTQTLAATGSAPITWNVTSGALPAGLSLGSSTGVISGTPTATGVFTPTITATNAGGSNSQQLNLTVNALVTVVLTPSSVSLLPSQIQTFTATVSGTSNTNVTWSLSPALGGTASSATTLVYGAPSTAPTTQTVTITAASMADPSKIATAVITLLQAITVSLSPSTVSLAPSGAQQFTAMVLGTSTAAVTWSINPSVGTINSAGLYTAPSTILTSQTITVRAQSVADPTKSASVPISLSAPVSTDPSFTYYVDSVTGSDSNPGTLVLPWKTLAKVNAATLSPGQSVRFKAGGVWRETLVVPNSGRAGNPITFGAYGSGENPVISGSDNIAGFTAVSTTVWDATVMTQPSVVIVGATPPHAMTASKGAIAAAGDWYWSSNVLSVYATSNPSGTVESGSRAYGGIRTNDKSYITVDGLTVRNGNGQGVNVGSVSVTGIVFKNCVVEGNAANGFDLKGSTTSHDVTIDNCKIQNNGDWGIAVNNQYTTSSTISNSVLTGNGWNSIAHNQEYSQIDGALGNFNIFGNTISATTPRGCKNGGSLGDFCHGIYYSAGFGGDRTVPANIYQNTIYNDRYGDGIKAVGSAAIYENTIYANNDSGIGLGQNGAVNVVYQVYFNLVYSNNLSNSGGGIVEQTKGVGTISLSIDNNTVYQNGGTTQQELKIADDLASTLTIRNNILFATPTRRTISLAMQTGAVSIDYNLHWRTDGNPSIIVNGAPDTWAQWRNLGFDTHAPTPSDPLFNSPPGDFTLRTGSPGIGTGVYIPGIVAAKPPNIGAF